MLNFTNTEEKIYKKFNFPKNHAAKIVSNDKKVDTMALIGSFVGVSIGFAASLALTHKNKPSKDIFIKNNIKQSAKNLLNFTKVDYEGAKGWLCMLMQAMGASLGSMAFANVMDKDKENRVEKLKEAIFMINNVAIPAACAKSMEYLITDSKLTKKDIINKLGKNKLTKNVAVFSALFAGLAASLKITNKINTKIIEPDDKKEKKIHPKDLLVHVDDIIPVLITSKGSIFQKLPFDYLMPVIYFMLGSEAGKKNYYENDR